MASASKPEHAQQNAKNKPVKKMQKCQKNRCNVRGQGLIGLEVCIFCIFEPVQVLELPGLDFFISLSLCRFWSLGRLTPAQAQKNPRKQILYLFLKNGRQIAELFPRSIVLQNFPEVSISVSGLLLHSLQHIACCLPQVDTLVPVSPLGRSNSKAQDGAPGGAVDILQVVAQKAPKPIHDLRARSHADLTLPCTMTFFFWCTTLQWATFRSFTLYALAPSVWSTTCLFDRNFRPIGSRSRFLIGPDPGARFFVRRGLSLNSRKELGRPLSTSPPHCSHFTTRSARTASGSSPLPSTSQPPHPSISGCHHR